MSLKKGIVCKTTTVFEKPTLLLAPLLPKFSFEHKRDPRAPFNVF